MNLQGKTALITGAASGIGYQLSKDLVEKGMKVLCLDLSAPDQPIDGVEYFEINVTDVAAVKDFFASFDGVIDVLVNNAGIMRRGTYDKVSEEDYDLTMSVNVKGPWLILKYGRAKFAKDVLLLQMSSKNARFYKETTFAYSLSKIAIAGISHLIAKTEPNWRVKTAYPGPVDTELIWVGDYTKEEAIEKRKILVSPEMLAGKLAELIENDSYQDLLYDQEKRAYSYSLAK